MSAKSNVILVEKSENAKLGGMATTHACLATCPDSCPLKASGACYRNTGSEAYVAKSLDAHQSNMRDSHLTIAKKEASLIDNLKNKVDLRLHTVGDCKSAPAARAVSDACERFMERTGGVAYTYTHAWRDVPRKAWGKVSVLASCESIDDVKLAMKRGYAAAMVIPQYRHETWKATMVGDLRMMPCPKQTGKAESCKTCRVCMRDGLLRKGKVVVVLAAHGPTKRMRTVLEALAKKAKEL